MINLLSKGTSRAVRRTFWLIKVVPTWKKFEKRCYTWSPYVCCLPWRAQDGRWNFVRDMGWVPLYFIMYLFICIWGAKSAIVQLDWLATGRTRKHLGLNCIRPFVRRLCLFSSIIYRGTCTAPSVRPPRGRARTARAEVCGPLVGEPRTARAERSPLLARKESFGREMADWILSYRG
jgi:hypothetical protein